MPAKGNPQGYDCVENATNLDWENVEPGTITAALYHEVWAATN